MQLIRNFNTRTATPEGAVATIGTFDGVHRGHQVILEKLQVRSRELGLPSMVVTFEPSANEFFLGSHAPARLTNFREKFRLIEMTGIDRFVCLSFNQALATMHADTFIRDILVTRLNIRHLTIGDDFHYGHDRKGDYELLKNLSVNLGFNVENTESVVINRERVSSSSIRDYLAEGRLDQAAQLLGRSYSMSGRVIRGDQRGRVLGFPTANVPIKRRFSPVSGVFAVKVRLENGVDGLGVANVGHRPTVAGTRTQIEVHVFDFSQDIYGTYLSIFFCKKIRNEKKFNSLEELKNQIQLDAESAREFFRVAD